MNKIQFNSRQISLLSALCRHSDEYITLNLLAAECQTSKSSIKNHLNSLQDFLDSNKIHLIAKPGKGYMLSHEDALFLNEIIEAGRNDEYDQLYRVNKLILLLSYTNSYVSLSRLEDALYISRSQLYADLKILKTRIHKYSLTVKNKYGYGIKIDGSEINKRLCIIKENLYGHQVEQEINFFNNDIISSTSEIIMDVLAHNDYEISDLILQNLVVHVLIALNRMYANHYIEPEGIQDVFQNKNLFAHEILIAESIYRKLCRKYNIQINENEIYFLAINLKGKKNYHSANVISKEMDTFVTRILLEIQRQFQLDLTLNANLRIALALHLIPLLTRLKYNMQLTNDMKDEIKASFPFAYELSVITSDMIQNTYHYALSDDEISYIAIHFSNHIEQLYQQKKEKKKILIISCARSSNSLLIYSKIQKKFVQDINAFTIIQMDKLDSITPDEFDAILSTSLKYPKIPEKAIKISEYIDEQDCKIISSLLNDDYEKIHVKNYITKELIYEGRLNDKNQLLKKLCELAAQKYNFDLSELLASVLEREKLGFTSYGNYVAVPHTMTRISDETFITAGLLHTPLKWDEDNVVYLVILISLGKKENHDLYSLYSSLSKLISNKDFIETLIKTPSIDKLLDFIQLT